MKILYISSYFSLSMPTLKNYTIDGHVSQGHIMVIQPCATSAMCDTRHGSFLSKLSEQSFFYPPVHSLQESGNKQTAIKEEK